MLDLIKPDWPSNKRVKAFSTTRTGGFSTGTYASLNLGHHVGEDQALVQQNRQLLPGADSTCWLSQVHGTNCIEARHDTVQYCEADSAFTTVTELVCGVMTADCAPILLCDRSATCVAAIHAGWRGLAAGVVQNCVAKMPAKPNQLMAWIGPCIGAAQFEVGEEVRRAFDLYSDCFSVSDAPGKYMADLKALCANTLKLSGVEQVYTHESCTYSEPHRFYSHRYSTHYGEGVTGRMFTGIYLT